MFSMVQARMRGLWNRRYFFWSRLTGPEVPVHSLSWLPDGFRIQPVGRSGACVTDSFCTPEEAEQIKSGLTDSLGALVHRAALLIGGTARHLDEVTLLRVRSGGEQDTRQLVSGSENGVRNAGVCVCLDGDSEYALTLRGNGQDIEIQSRTGRALSYFPGGSGQAAPDYSLQTSQTERQAPQDVWMLKFWFCEQPVRKEPLESGAPRQTRTGVPLTGSEALPEGVWAPGQDHLEAVFGKPDQITDAVRQV